MQLSKFDKLKQKLCRHKNAIPIDSMKCAGILNGHRKVYTAKHYCCRCGLTFEKVMEEV